MFDAFSNFGTVSYHFAFLNLIFVTIVKLVFFLHVVFQVFIFHSLIFVVVLTIRLLDALWLSFWMLWLSILLIRVDIILLCS